MFTVVAHPVNRSVRESDVEEFGISPRFESDQPP